MKCQWFALCTNEAEGTLPFITNPVPTCKRCADKFDNTLQPLPIEVARASWIRLMMPRLLEILPTVATEYGVELARLEGRSPEQVATEFSECAREGHQHNQYREDGSHCLYCGLDLS